MSSLVIDENQGGKALDEQGSGHMAMSRFHAFVIHLMISCVVVLAFLAIMKQFWYPDFFFEASAGWGVLKILIMVDLVLGPLITLIIFKAGKPGLKFDLSVIAALQIAALLYGGSVVYQNRPGYLVFAVDRFEVVAASLIEDKAIPDAELRRTFSNPIPMVFASLPEDNDQREKILFEVVSGAVDIEMRPELYKPFQENFDKVFMKSINISMLTSTDSEADSRVRAFVSDLDANPDDFLYYPLVGKNKDMLIVFPRSGGQPVGVIDTNPWLS